MKKNCFFSPHHITFYLEKYKFKNYSQMHVIGTYYLAVRYSQNPYVYFKSIKMSWGLIRK